MTYSIPALGDRFRLRSRRLTMVVAAGAIAFASLAAATRPARADAEDLLRFLAGAVIIGAIVNAVDDRHTPQYINRWVLPDSCLETVRVDRRNVQVYNARCLSRGGYNNLPDRCERNFRVNGHGRHGYVAECMWDAGYSREQGHGRPPRYDNGGYGGGYDGRPDDHYRRPVPPAPASPPSSFGNRVLPEHCEMAYRENGQRRNGYWGSCLRNSGLRNLPDQCRQRTRDGDAVYNRRCMMDAGYRRNR